MESGLQSFFTLIIVVQFTIGNLSNGFVVLINCIDWVSKRKLSSVDQILSTLALSRIGVIWEILMPQSDLVHALCLAIGLIYPSSHSLILILGNSKLRQASLLVLRQLKCGTKDETFTTP
ncbi:Taste receptor type 2 member 13 [Heterocephalus glaber]|uniref:Taste receptor type 2 member 13 n=1 Tax=Heterocephalus glaber TaxID=10181 RepID=G5BDZ2_HETGA|nr:Taste receptor type 2 member 13 [Heterocephalus glaber]